MKEDQARKSNITILNRVLYSNICHLKNIVVQTQLMLAVMNALDELENEMHSH